MAGLQSRLPASGLPRGLAGCRLLHREEIGKVVIGVHVFEALDRPSLHGHQDGLASHGRIERERLRRDDPSLHQQVARAVHDVLRRRKVANSPARRAKAGQADAIALTQAVGITRNTIRLADRLGKITRALHRASHHRKDDLRSAAAVQNRLRQIEPIACKSVDLRGVDEFKHLPEIHPERNRVVDKAPRGLRKDRIGCRVGVGKLHACPQRAHRARGARAALESHLLSGGQRIRPLVVGVVHNLLDEDPHGAVAGVSRIRRRACPASDGRGVAVFVVRYGHVGKRAWAESDAACDDGRGAQNGTCLHACPLRKVAWMVRFARAQVYRVGVGRRRRPGRRETRLLFRIPRP